MGLNIVGTLREQIVGLSKTPWVQHGIRYLGIKLSDDPCYRLTDNILSYKNGLQNTLRGWQKRGISWWGRLAVLKMEVLPVLLFLFQNSIIHVPLKYIDERQEILKLISVER